MAAAGTEARPTKENVGCALRTIFSFSNFGWGIMSKRSNEKS
jgi:hypothetical protein